MRYKLGNTLLTMTAVLFFLIELYCMKLSYFTTGELYSRFFGIVIITLNLIIATLLMLSFIFGDGHKKISIFKSCAIGLMGSLALITILPEIYWGHKYLTLKTEGDSLIQYIYAQKNESGTFPTSLPSNVFLKSELRRHFDYTFISDDQFTLFYYVKTKQTSHSFSDTASQNEHLGWKYYPD